jgi:Glycosyltransferase family 92
VTPKPHYLGIGAIYRWEAENLREWVAFHRVVGVDRFFMYDNASEDDHLEALAPFIEDGSVTVHPWPVFPGQGSAYDHCLARHGDEVRWIAFLDVDEFLFSPATGRLPELLAEYEEWAGVCVHRAEFGTSGHKERPEGLVLENFVHRARQPPDSRGHFKSIVDPARVARCASVHHFVYREGNAVDENGSRIVTGIRPERTVVSFSRLRINHYRTKSEEEMRRKWAMWEERGLSRLEIPAIRVEMSSIYEPDETITSYVPALREALSA